MTHPTADHHTDCPVTVCVCVRVCMYARPRTTVVIPLFKQVTRGGGVTSLLAGQWPAGATDRSGGPVGLVEDNVDETSEGIVAAVAARPSHSMCVRVCVSVSVCV